MTHRVILVDAHPDFGACEPALPIGRYRGVYPPHIDRLLDAEYPDREAAHAAAEELGYEWASLPGNPLWVPIVVGPDGRTDDDVAGVGAPVGG